MSGQFKYPQDREKSSAAKVAALESLLIEKGVITPQTVDKVLAYFESEMAAQRQEDRRASADRRGLLGPAAGRHPGRNCRTRPARGNGRPPSASTCGPSLTRPRRTT